MIPVAVPLLLVAAFEGYALHSRSSPVHYSRGGEAFAQPAATFQPPQVRTASPAPTPSAAPIAGAVPTSPSRAGRARTRGTVAGLQASPKPASPRSSQVVVPRTGTYELSVSGSEKVDFGPVSFCSQSLPRSTTLVVSPAAGESPTSFNFDLRYFPDQSGKHDERHIYRYTPAGVFLDYEIATVTCQGVRQSSDTDYSPPQLRARLPLRVGGTWATKGGDDDRTETSSTKVLRVQAVEVDGEQVTTYVIETTTSFTGSESGSRTQTWWFAPTWAMPVKWSQHIDGGRSGASYREDVTVTVTSRP